MSKRTKTHGSNLIWANCTIPPLLPSFGPNLFAFKIGLMTMLHNYCNNGAYREETLSVWTHTDTDNESSVVVVPRPVGVRSPDQAHYYL